MINLLHNSIEIPNKYIFYSIILCHELVSENNEIKTKHEIYIRTPVGILKKNKIVFKFEIQNKEIILRFAPNISNLNMSVIRILVIHY